MIEKIIIASLETFAVWYTLQEGQIFGAFGAWLKKVLPEEVHNPVFDCPICMGFWYGGTIGYWLTYNGNWKEWLIVAIGTIGLNVILSKLFPIPPEKFIEEIEENNGIQIKNDSITLINSGDIQNCK